MNSTPKTSPKNLKEIQRHLKSLDDKKLYSSTRAAREKEQLATGELLYHLCEIEKRKLYAQWGYPNLHQFCVKELRYDDAAASRRIMASRALCVSPKIEQSLKQGKVTLSSLAQVQRHIQRQKFEHHNELSLQEKKSLFEKIEGLSSRETEKVILELDPTLRQKKKEVMRVVTPEETEVRFYASKALTQKLDRLRGLYFHRNPNPAISQLMEWIVDSALEREDPERRNARRLQRQNNAKPRRRSSEPTRAPSPANAPRSRSIPQTVRDRIFDRAKSQCEFRSPHTHVRCSAASGLQIDHIHPFSRGGTHSESNLQVLCYKHNALKGSRVV